MFAALFPCIPSQDTFLLGASNFQQRVLRAASHPSSFNQSEGTNSIPCGKPEDWLPCLALEPQQQNARLVNSTGGLQNPKDGLQRWTQKMDSKCGLQKVTPKVDSAPKGELQRWSQDGLQKMDSRKVDSRRWTPKGGPKSELQKVDSKENHK